MSRDWLAYFKAKRGMGAVICEGPEIEAACAEIEALLARHNALVEAKQTISECLQDTAFRNGVKAGWNAAVIKDNTEAERKYAQLMADNDGRLATLKAARAEVDRLLGDE